jgi:uncharacterized membrane protein
MEFIELFLKTILLRPYVFAFLAAFLFAAVQLIGWPRTWRFWLISWGTAFVSEFLSTRTGIPFGWYQYNGSTVEQELYIFNIPFMASISFSFLLFAVYCVTLCVFLPTERTSTSAYLPLVPLQFEVVSRSSRSTLILSSLFFALIDMVIDPLALRGDRWFLGSIYNYAAPGVHFGVPLTNYLGWFVVGLISLSIYCFFDRRLPPLPPHTDWSTTHRLLLGVGLYYAVLVFNLGVTFWIGEWHIAFTGVLIHLPITAWLGLRLAGSLSPLKSFVTERSTKPGGNQRREFV